MLSGLSGTEIKLNHISGFFKWEFDRLVVQIVVLKKPANLWTNPDVGITTGLIITREFMSTGAFVKFILSNKMRTIIENLFVGYEIEELIAPCAILATRVLEGSELEEVRMAENKYFRESRREEL